MARELREFGRGSPLRKITGRGTDDPSVIGDLAGDQVGVAHSADADVELETFADEVYRPVEESVIQFVRTNGEKAMYESLALRKACCGIRKMEPLGRMLTGRTAWVTGLRRDQSNARGEAQAVETDDNGRAKISPLVDWSWNDVWHYIATHEVPYNPLHDQFMPSIGCAPCTRAIAVGQEFRAGRWWWEDESAKECGLHVKQPAA